MAKKTMNGKKCSAAAKKATAHLKEDIGGYRAGIKMSKKKMAEEKKEVKKESKEEKRKQKDLKHEIREDKDLIKAFSKKKR